MSLPVHVVDGDANSRQAVSLLVRSLDLAPVLHATASAFVESVDRDLPACVVLEHALPDRPGLALHREIREWSTPWIRVLVVSRGLDVPTAVEFMQTGAAGVLEKPFAAHDLSQLLQSSAREAARIHVEAERYRDVERRWRQLTEPELAILPNLVRGDPTKIVAREIDVSERTIERRQARIFRVFGVESSLALTRLVTEYENWRARW